MPGETYDQRRVDRALQALRRLPFLEAVEGSELVPEGERTVLVVRVREARAARLEGGLAYAPGAGRCGSGDDGSVCPWILTIFSAQAGRGQVRWSSTGGLTLRMCL